MSQFDGSYAIRIHPSARRDIDEAINRMAVLTDEKYAADWHDGLLDKMASLATFPHRFPIAKENRLFQAEVRVVSYRYTSSAAVYLILYSIYIPADDAPFIHVLHIRHAARKPMTRAEARKIEENQTQPP